MSLSFMPQKRRRRRDPVLIIEESCTRSVPVEVREMLNFLYELELPRSLRSDIIARPNPRYL